MGAAGRRMSAADRDKYYAADLSGRSILREGKPNHKFNVRIHRYTEHGRLTKSNITQSEIDWMLNTGNCGIRMEILGYGTSMTVLLKWRDIPISSAFVEWEHDVPFIDDTIDFPGTLKEDKLAEHLGRELYETKGDAVAYVQVLMKYYKTSEMQLK